MPPPTFSRPPGFYDRTAPESAVAAAVVATMQRAMSRFGYQVVGFHWSNSQICF
jgi:hypothetical protein